ncbi:MAG TPA: hypothetical protein VGG46_04860 [Terriglobales bacterium]|jgi:hypothetical protein
MRIVSIRAFQVAKVLGIVYTLFGFTTFILYAVRGDEALTLPFGILAPLVNLNVNLTLPHMNGVLYNIFLCAAALISYAVTGWITGMFLAFCFNFIAKKTNGIEAKYLFIPKEEIATDIPTT